MDWSDTGFVVAKGLFREADVWLRILFRGHGMQTVFAFGGAHSRRRFVGCLDVMNILTCRVSPSRRGTYLLFWRKGRKDCVTVRLSSGSRPTASSSRGLSVCRNSRVKKVSGFSPKCWPASNPGMRLRFFFPFFSACVWQAFWDTPPASTSAPRAADLSKARGVSLSRRPVCSVRSARPVHGAEALFFRQKRLTSCGMYSKNILFHGLRLVFRRRTGARQPRP